MKKKFNWSIILPMIYILGFLAFFAMIIKDGLKRGWSFGKSLAPVIEIITVPMFGIPIAAFIIGSIIALVIIIKYDLHIGKHILLYIATVLVSHMALLFAGIIYRMFMLEWMVILALAGSFTLILLAYREIKDVKVRAVMILESPIMYYLIMLVLSLVFPIIILD